jgi:hypothetical protein
VCIAVEVALLAAFVQHRDVWEWWRDGERFEGTVTQVRLPYVGSDENDRLVTIENTQTGRASRRANGSAPVGRLAARGRPGDGGDDAG